MNILPKKNWHVRKKENIARVRRDEAEAAEKEKENERRIKLAEQEARIAFMRKRARERDGNASEEEDAPVEKKTKLENEADIYTAAGNINFFKEAESGGAKTDTNKDYEKEKKDEKEAYEKKIGLLTYLGQDTLEAAGQTAWFAEKEHIINKNSETNEEVGLKSKLKLDPLKEIMKHTDFKIYPKIENTIAEINLPPSSERIIKPKSKNLCRKDKKHKREKRKKRKHSHSSSETETRKKKKQKHSKKKKKRAKYTSSEDDEEEEEEKRKQLIKLREERLKREARERKREERLLAGKNPDEEEKPKLDLPFKQKYNSQFNPHLARQNQEEVVPLPTLQPGVKYWLK